MKITLPHHYTPRPYQLPFWKAMIGPGNPNGKRRAYLLRHRRAGKDKDAFNYMIQQAFQRVGVYYYFFPSYAQGRKALWDNVDKDGFKFLDHIPKSLILGQPNQTEMKVPLKNGSLIQVVGSDNIDTVVGSNPVGVVFSEYSLQDPSGYNFVRPILRENGGWAVFTLCVAPDTMIFTRDGMRTIGEELKDAPLGFSEHRQWVFGLRGAHQTEMAYKAGRQKTLKITTSKGYSIECTPIHPIWNGNAWKEAKDWAIGDRIPIQSDQQMFGNGSPEDWRFLVEKKRHGHCRPLGFDLDEDFCYFVGLYIAEGSEHDKNITISNQDEEIIAFLERHGFVYRGEAHSTRRSQVIVEILNHIGVGKGAKNKRLSNTVLSLKKEYLREVLRGFFDGDGCATKRGSVHCDTVSEALARQIQMVLLNFGIVSRLTDHWTKPTERVKVSSHCWRVEVEGNMAARFFERIGFRLTRKQERYALLTDRQRRDREDRVYVTAEEITDEYLVGMNQGHVKRQIRRGRLAYCTLRMLNDKKSYEFIEGLLMDGYYWDSIVSIEESENEVMDFVIPSTHSFTTNGFISHNTPRGKNHAFDLYEMAKNNPEWFTEKLTIDDTYGHGGTVSPEQVDEERQSGMSESLIQQEFYSDFNAAVEHAVFAEQLLQARKEGRITTVPWQRGLPVNTYWDIGRDTTAIWFEQTLRNEVRLIDYHSAMHSTLDQEIHLLQQKPYVYGTHYMPHDADYRDYKTGTTPKEVAAELGLPVDVLPKTWEHAHIDAARMLFNRVWIDAEKCENGIASLQNWHYAWDEKTKSLGRSPLHDWSSHGAKSFCYIAVGHEDEIEWKKPDKYAKNTKKHRSWMTA